MDTHAFKPSRQSGTVCIALRAARALDEDGAEVCGYPTGHPIHAAAPVAEQVDRPPLRKMLGDLMAEVEIDVTEGALEASPRTLALIDRIVDLYGGAQQ